MATLFEEVRVFDGTVEITCKPHALKMAVVRNAKDLGDQWKSPGIYVLLGSQSESSWRAYVGKSNQLSGRFAQDRDFEWHRALLVRHSVGFDSAEAGWLEGRMHGLLEAAGVDLENTQRPGDPTLPVSKQESLERYVEVIQDALVLLGYDLSGRRKVNSGQSVTPTAEAVGVTDGPVSRNAARNAAIWDAYLAGEKLSVLAERYGFADSAGPDYVVTLEAKRRGVLRPRRRKQFTGPLHSTHEVFDIGVEYGKAGKVHRKLLHVVDVGTQIESTSPSHGANATVEGTGIRYDGELYNSLSAAAKAVTGDDTADGWSFWGLRLESGVVKKLKLVRDAHGDDAQSPPRRGAKGGRKRRSKTTPARMSATKRARLLSRRDEGATYAELRREFGMSQAGVYTVLKEGGRVDDR